MYVEIAQQKTDNTSGIHRALNLHAEDTVGALPTALKTAHSPRRGTEHQHWAWGTGTTWKHPQGGVTDNSGSGTRLCSI